MRAAVFVAKDQINIREVPVPTPGPNQALVKVTLTTICGTDVDHSEAKVFYVDAATFNEILVRAPHHHVRRHQGATAENSYPADEQHFYHEVAVAAFMSRYFHAIDRAASSSEGARQ